jgi:hypothetical protein
MFRDDRSFGKYFHLPTWIEVTGREGYQPAGVYDPKSNALNIFDWRNVPIRPRSAYNNMQTLSHEGTHQLTFNTGLLNRQGDTPRAIVEGLGTYGEARKIMGSSDLGRPNLMRMEILAKLQRRMAWIPVRQLLTDDTILRASSSDRVMLAMPRAGCSCITS